MVTTILIYIHLAVIFGIGALLCCFENKYAKMFGALNATFSSVYAYLYAVYQLWQVFRG